MAMMSSRIRSRTHQGIIPSERVRIIAKMFVCLLLTYNKYHSIKEGNYAYFSIYIALFHG